MWDEIYAKNIDNKSTYLKGFNFDSTKANDLNEIGLELSKVGRYEEGKDYFLKSLKIEPNNPITLCNLGLNRFHVSNYKSAIEYYNKSLEASNYGYKLAGINLAVAYYNIYEYDKGIKVSDFMIKTIKNDTILASAHINKALNLIGSKRCDEAEDEISLIFQKFRKIKHVQPHITDLNNKIEKCSPTFTKNVKL